MSRGRGTINKVILVGRLGADPQLKFTPSGRALATFTLATNLSWKDQDGNAKEKTEWHRITAWGKLAEVMGEWLKKGSLVYLEGRLQTRSYEDANGATRYVTDVVATDMEMLGGKSASAPTSTPPEIPAVPEAEEQEPKDDLPF